MAFLVKRPAWTAWAGPTAGIVVGLALMAAPALLGYVGTGQEVAQRIGGPLLVMLWIVSYWEATRSLIWWTGAIGAVMLLACAIIAGPAEARIAGMAGAGATLLISLLTHPGRVQQRYAGGWIGLWRGDVTGLREGAPPPHQPARRERPAS